jgi:hypothetical protein
MMPGDVLLMIVVAVVALGYCTMRFLNNDDFWH